MKTNIYNNKEHIEGYVGKGDSADKSAVQIEYEKGNDTNEVVSFGKEPIANSTAKILENEKISIRDGYDNTGTQGKDSLSDDAYNSTDRFPSVESAESRTGSSSKDFQTTLKEQSERDEDDVLNSGI